MKENSYTQILDFLERYGGYQYKMLTRCSPGEEYDRMKAGSDAGRASRAAFTEIVDKICLDFDLQKDRVTQWQNSGTFVRYFWSQLKREPYKDSNISLSLFAEKGHENIRFRASVELAVEASEAYERKQYYRILDLPLKEGLVYISGGNNENEFRIINETDNNKVKEAHYKKVQVSFIISKNQFNDDAEFYDLLDSGVEKLLEYYDYALSDGEGGQKSDDWWPSLAEYTPSITKEQWLDFLGDRSIVNTEACATLIAFYDEGGAATCTQIGNKYEKKPFSLSGILTALARNISKRTGCPLAKNEGKDKYWPVLFQGKDAGKDELGSFLWKLRPELSDAIEESDIEKYRWKVGEKPVPLTAKETLDLVKKYIASRGFSYEDDLIENFYLSLKSKPFVILAGTSGTGKTRLVRLFAKAIGATATNKRYLQVAVRPDWSDSSDLFGHLNLSGKFVPGAILPFLKAATEDLEHPYILCFDEMNLARVEYYMSDFLSIIESRDLRDGGITSDLIMTEASYGTDDDAVKKYGNIGFPQNLYIVGTVNMDETTFPFSRKVLDRANTIEFNYVDLTHDFSIEHDSVEPYEASNDFLMSKYLVLDRDCRVDAEYIGLICSELQDINIILQRANAHVGYRVRDDIIFYMLNNKEAGLLSRDEAFDNAIMQKILPRIQGSSNSVKVMLCELFNAFAGTKIDVNAVSNDVAAEMRKTVDNWKKKNIDSSGNVTGPDGVADEETTDIDVSKTVKISYPKSAEKIAFMVQRFEEDGFTSYWL